MNIANRSLMLLLLPLQLNRGAAVAGAPHNPAKRNSALQRGNVIAASDVDKIITLDRLSIICRISQFSYNMGVHVNITVLVNALFAEWASMVKPTVLVNAFFAEYRRFRTTWASVRDDRVVYRPFPIVDSRCFGLWAGVPLPLLLWSEY